MFVESDKYKNRGNSSHHAWILHVLTVSNTVESFFFSINVEGNCLAWFPESSLALHLCSDSLLKT